MQGLIILTILSFLSFAVSAFKVELFVCNSEIDSNSGSSSTSYNVDFPTDSSISAIPFSKAPSSKGVWNTVIDNPNIIVSNFTTYRINSFSNDGLCIQGMRVDDVQLFGNQPFWLDYPCEGKYNYGCSTFANWYTTDTTQKGLQIDAIKQIRIQALNFNLNSLLIHQSLL